MRRKAHGIERRLRKSQFNAPNCDVAKALLEINRQRASSRRRAAAVNAIAQETCAA
jgi:hypothetical protein